MAKCGCGSTACQCAVKAGANVTVTGNGSSGSPYIVSASTATVTEADTPTVDMHVTGGPNYTVSADVIPDNARAITNGPNGVGVCLSTDAGNELSFGSDGCLFAPADTALTSGNGIDAAALAGGVIQACLSTDVGNGMSFGTDGCLYAAAGAGTPVTVLDTNSVDLTLLGQQISADVIRDPEVGNILTIGAAGLDVNLNTGCGLTGDGTLASPLIVDTNAAVWPFACAESNGGKVYCDPVSGGLVVDPEKFSTNDVTFRIIVPGTQNVNTLQAGPYPKPVATFGPTFSLVVTNPSPCRSMEIRVEAGFNHFNMRMNNAGRGNVLVGLQVSMAGGVAFGPAAVYHQQWMRDYNNAEADNTFDSSGSIDINLAGPAFVLAPGAATTITAQGNISITNYDPGMAITLFDLQAFIRATGFNI